MVNAVLLSFFVDRATGVGCAGIPLVLTMIRCAAILAADGVWPGLIFLGVPLCVCLTGEP